MNKQEVWVIKDAEGLFWGRTGWVNDINYAVYYFSAESAQKKGPNGGKVTRAIATTTLKEAK